MVSKRKKKNRQDIYVSRLTFWMTKRDKRFLFELSKETGKSYSAIVRGALHDKYSEAFECNE